MEKKIENLRWKPRWVSHLGCIKGCLEYLKLDVSDAWLFGATGHAFIINMHEIVCPSGPTAWNTEMLFRLGKNIGYTIEGVFGRKSDIDFALKQKSAWEKTKQALNEGLPCYGWELAIPEYYVVYGYDDKGYYFSGPMCDPEKGPKSWEGLGNSEIGVLEMYCVKPGHVSDDTKTVKEAFEFALEHSKSPEKRIFPKYKAGLSGFDSWINALERGIAHSWGMAFNAAVWSECRGFAVEFLKEARVRIGGKSDSLFDEAIRDYERIAGSLKELTELFPFPPKGTEVGEVNRCTSAVECLKYAKDAEESGLKALEKIVSRL
jgi:hypothetical protein